MALDHLTSDWLLAEFAKRSMGFAEVYGLLSRRVAGENFDAYREADRWLQKQRKAGILIFHREGRTPIWTLTKTGRAALAAVRGQK